MRKPWLTACCRSKAICFVDPMKLDTFLAVLARCESLATAIETGIQSKQTAAVEAGTASLTELLIHLQRGLAPLSEQLSTLPEQERALLARRLQDVMLTYQRVNTVADLLSQDATARFSALADAAGTELSYSPDGQLGR